MIAKKERWTYMLVGLALITVVFNWAEIGLAQTSDPIKIAHVAVTSGPFSSLGMGGKNAIMVWEKLINQKGGLLGRSVKVLYYDTSARPATAIEMLKKAVYDDKVDFIISTDSSGVILASYPIMKELKKVYISGTAAAEEMQNTTNRYCFHASQSSRTHGYALAKILFEKYPQIKRAVGVNPDYAWGRAAWAGFNESFKKFQPAAEFPQEHWPPFGALDFKPYISQILGVTNLKECALYTSLWAGDQVTFNKQAKAFGLFDKIAIFLDGSSTNMEVNKALGAEGVQAWGNSHYSYLYDCPSNKEFVREYQAMWGKTTLPDSAGGGTYRACQILEGAIRKAGKIETMAVIEALENLHLETVSGPSYVREWDHIIITDYVCGFSAPDPNYPFWTWKNPYFIKSEEIDKLVIPKEKYKGWRGNP